MHRVTEDGRTPDWIFAGVGELRALCRQMDWSATSLGASEK